MSERQARLELRDAELELAILAEVDAAYHAATALARLGDHAEIEAMHASIGRAGNHRAEAARLSGVGDA